MMMYYNISYLVGGIYKFKIEKILYTKIFYVILMILSTILISLTINFTIKLVIKFISIFIKLFIISCHFIFKILWCVKLT